MRLSKKRLERVQSDPVFQQILGAVGGEVPALDEADQTKIAVRFYLMLQNTLSWGTTCLNCSNLLDRCYEADMRREEAEGRAVTAESDAVHWQNAYYDCYD